MKLLLDTHIWIWAVLERERLTPPVRDELARADSELWLSPVSIWEVVLLIEKGRFRTNPAPAAWMAAAREELMWREAPFTTEVALEAASFGLPHRDPSDRLLVATARWYGLTLVTADAMLLSANACALLPNR